jgi:hypothetical protein
MRLYHVAIGLVSLLSTVSGAVTIGANWGTQATHPLDPAIVVRLLRENGIQKVKLFDADYDTLKALGKTGIEVMVGIPNDMLATLASSMKAAEKWVSKNVSAHVTSNNVNIRSNLLLLLCVCVLFPDLVYKKLRLLAEINCLLSFL